MDYNTQMKALILPEYGRNIQNMVNHCLTIEDREERMLCAQTIIKTMGNKFPQFRDEENLKHILWDHLAIMSDFKLDIDYPFEVIKKENLVNHPDKVPYSSSKKIQYMHYGKTTMDMIAKAIEMEDIDMRRDLELRIANYMKKCYILFNKGGIEDRKILDDLKHLSKGQIILTPDTHLEEFKDSSPKQNQTSKKKKKNR